MSIQEIATFVEAAEKGSMAAASRALGVPTSTVSRRIHRLEEALGVQLVETHARLFRLTEAGDALLKRSAAAVRDLREAAHAIRDGSDTVRGQLRISAALDLGSSAAMARLLADFRSLNPGIELLVDLADRRVDLMAEGVDFAFRIHVGALRAQPSLMVRRLATLSGGLFASPSYLARHGTPRSVEELAQHSLISPTFQLPWRLCHTPTGSVEILETIAPVRSTSLSFMVPAACADMGIAPAPGLVVGPSLARGELVRVLPQWHLLAASLSLLWPASRLPAPRRRTFLDFVVAHTEPWSTLADGHTPA